MQHKITASLLVLAAAAICRAQPQAAQDADKQVVHY